MRPANASCRVGSGVMVHPQNGLSASPRHATPWPGAETLRSGNGDPAGRGRRRARAGRSRAAPDVGGVDGAAGTAQCDPLTEASRWCRAVRRGCTPRRPGSSHGLHLERRGPRGPRRSSPVPSEACDLGAARWSVPYFVEEEPPAVAGLVRVAESGFDPTKSARTPRSPASRTRPATDRDATEAVGQDLLQRGVPRLQVRHHVAFAHHEEPVAHPEGLLEVAGDEHDGAPLVRDVADEAVDLLLRPDVDAPGGFVEEEDVGVGGEPFGDDHLLLIAAGERG